MHHLSVGLVFTLVFSAAAGAGEICFYRMKWEGRVPELAQVRQLLDPKTVVRIAALIDPDGKFEIDETDDSVAPPDPEAKEPSKQGTILSGKVTQDPGKDGKVRVRFRFRECRIVGYVQSKESRWSYPRWTESSLEGIARIGPEGWALVDPVSGEEARELFVVQLKR